MDNIDIRKIMGQLDAKNYISYRELEANHNFPSLKDYIGHDKYKGQEKITEYLKNGMELMTLVAIPTDIFTKKVIPYDCVYMTDGYYYWPLLLAYYVEKYNLRLPEVFEQHILKNSDK